METDVPLSRNQDRPDKARRMSEIFSDSAANASINDEAAQNRSRMTDMKLSLSLVELNQESLTNLDRERERDERQEIIQAAQKAATTTAEEKDQILETYMATREFEQKLRRANAGSRIGSKTISEVRAARQPGPAAESSGKPRMSQGQRLWKKRYQQRKDAERKRMRAAAEAGSIGGAGMCHSSSDGQMALPQAPLQVNEPRHNTARSSGCHMPLPQAAPLQVGRFEQRKEIGKVAAEKAEAFVDRSTIHKGDQAAMANGQKHQAYNENFDQAIEVEEDQRVTATTVECYRNEPSKEAFRVRERELENTIDKLKAQKAAGIGGRRADNKRHKAEVKKLKASPQDLQNTIDILTVEKEEAINQRNSDNLRNEVEIKELQASVKGLREHIKTLTAEAISQRIVDNQHSQAIIDDMDTKIQKHMDEWNEAMNKRYAKDAERITESERDEAEIKKLQACTKSLQRQVGQLSAEKKKAVQEREAADGRWTKDTAPKTQLQELKGKISEQAQIINDLQSSLGNLGLEYDAQRLSLRATAHGPVTPPDFAAAGATVQPTTPPMSRHRSQSESSSGYHSAVSRHAEEQWL